VVALLALSLASVFFAQLPQPRSRTVPFVWATATPIGILLGAFMGLRFERAA
jgi:uncharacterized membrane protein